MDNKAYEPGEDDTKSVEIDRRDEDRGLALKKGVGLVTGVCLIVGSMIGSGIFISPKGVLDGTKSVGFSMCVWAGCGVIAMLGSLCYAELGTMIKQSGCGYVYIDAAMGDAVAFLYIWVSFIITRSSAITVICMAFAEYVAAPIFDDCGPPILFVKILTVLAIVMIACVNGYSVNLAAKVQVFFTFAKLVVLIVIIVSGIVKLCQGNTQYLATGFEGSETSPSVIAFAFYDGLWAYDGWDTLNYVTEELKNPKRNLPRCLLISIPLVTVVYLLTNVSYLTVMSKEELLAADAVGVLWADRVLGSAGIIVPIGVAFSTFGAANGQYFSVVRLNFVAARKLHLPELLSYIHVRYVTPLPAIVVSAILAVIFVIPGDIYSLIDIFSFVTWIFNLLTFVSLIILRFRRPKANRPFKVNIVIPIAMVIISLYLVIAPIVQNPKIEFLYVAIFIFVGIFVYIPFVCLKWRFKFLSRLTVRLQLFMEVAPCKSYVDDDSETSDHRVEDDRRKTE